MRAIVRVTGLVVVLLIADGAAPASAPQQLGADALLIDLGYVTSVRARLEKNEPQLRSALEALEQDAKAALALTPPSVMDKGVTPPSGDKHDYMSQAPYWWPDPTKPDGKPYIQRDGERNPELKRISDHDNFGRVMGAVSTLGLAYRLTGREAYASQAARLARVWFLDPATRMNPHLRLGRAFPGSPTAEGSASSRRPGCRTCSMASSHCASPAWTAADQAGLDAWMRDYLTWLLESPHGQAEAKNGNNHETWYNVQVASLAHVHMPARHRAAHPRRRAPADRSSDPTRRPAAA